MLQWKDGKFQAFGLSFSIPDGCYLDLDEERVTENGVTIWTSDERYRIDIDIIDSSAYEAVEDWLKELLSPEGIVRILSPVQPLIVNGLTGCEVFYVIGSSSTYYYEARFSMTNGNGIILLVSGKDKAISSVKRFPEVLAALNSISTVI